MWMGTEGVESGWGQEGQKWRMVFHSQFVWPKGIKWACTLFLAISHTNIAGAHSCSSCLLIYFHLCSQVRKFGRVTKSTKRTCPWRVHLFLVDSLISSSTLFQSQTSLSSWYSNNSSLSLLYRMSQHVLCFVTEWNKLSTMKKLEWVWIWLLAHLRDAHLYSVWKLLCEKRRKKRLENISHRLCVPTLKSKSSEWM